MSRLPAWQECLDFVGRPIVVGPSHGQLSGDAGLLPVRQFDQRIGLTPAFANALDDPRDPDLTEHTFLEMVRSRVYGILAGYADQNDHDTLRADPAFKLVAGRCSCPRPAGSAKVNHRFAAARQMRKRADVPPVAAAGHTLPTAPATGTTTRKNVSRFAPRRG